MPSRLLLNVREAAIAFGPKQIFSDLSFSITEQDHICLVGKNGAGKSTLMNIITGKKDLDEGERWILQGTSIGYQEQEASVTPGKTIFSYIFDEMDLPDHQTDAQRYKIERVLEPLHLDPAARMETLSGGQLRRAALARALVEEPAILLLDEPTNHLDLEIIEWLEGYLKTYPGAFLCVSHDRAFLKAISNRVFWLDRGSLRVCPKGYAAFDEWSTALLEAEQKELARRQKNLDAEIAWAMRGVKARVKRNVRRLDTMKAERAKLKSDKSALSRMLAQISFTQEETGPGTSRAVATFYNVSKAFTKPDGSRLPVLDQFSFRLLRQDRIGILGRNGTGKTSFLSLLTGEMDCDSGKIKRAKHLSLAYFDQKRRDLKDELSLKRVLCPTGGDYINVMGKTRHVCGYLKDFLFDPKMVDQPVGTLSGGQKNRLMLAKVLAQPGDLLILDEPTNDLDMDTLDQLEDILSRYEGTLIVVSHDRDFLDQTVSKILAFEGDGHVEALIGGYSDYLAFKEKNRAQLEGVSAPKTAASKPPPPTAPRPKSNKKMPYKLCYELENLPQTMAQLEKETASLTQELSNPALYTQDPVGFETRTKQLAEKRAALDAAETRWLELEELKNSYDN